MHAAGTRAPSVDEQDRCADRCKQRTTPPQIYKYQPEEGMKDQGSQLHSTLTALSSSAA